MKLHKLLQVEPFKIVGLWTNGETRLNDFFDDVKRWKIGSNKELKKLANTKIFKTAFVKEGTLAFAGSTVQVPGIPGLQPIDFDRRVLYNDSQLIGNVVTYEDAVQHQKSRMSRKRRPAVLPEGFNTNSSSTKTAQNELASVSKLSLKIGGPITPLLIIGDELVELKTTWIFSDL